MQPTSKYIIYPTANGMHVQVHLFNSTSVFHDAVNLHFKMRPPPRGRYIKIERVVVCAILVSSTCAIEGIISGKLIVSLSLRETVKEDGINSIRCVRLRFIRIIALPVAITQRPAVPIMVCSTHVHPAFIIFNNINILE